MKNELKIFFTAIMFYTRIPVPKTIGFLNENLNKATRYFPLVGTLVGGIGALAFFGASQFMGLHVSIITALTAMILTTGAFHEDALSDFCDGFGGGYAPEKILAIMKDSRIGTYGAVGLVLLLLSKFMLLSEIGVENIPFVLISAHTLSRLVPVLLMYTSVYVSNPETSKSKPVGEKASPITLIVAIILGLAPMAYFYPVTLGVCSLVLSLILLYFRYYVHKKIGGYTGDVLGALQQISEVGIYITYLGVAKFIAR